MKELDENKIVMWGVHTQDDSLFLNKSHPVIAIGWEEMGNLMDIRPTKEDFKLKYSKIYPNASKQSVAHSASQLYKFFAEMKIGDYVVFPSKSNKEVNIGIIDGDYFYVEGERYPNRRAVKWIKNLPRTAFTQGALYEMGSFLSVFQIKNSVEEIIKASDKKISEKELIENEDDTIQATAESVKQSTQDFVLKQLNIIFKGYELEKVVENLLHAMGYHFTKRSQMGGDRGVDLIAYKDELPPRIVVQVKSINGDIPESMLQSLKGTLREGDYGLFVSLSKYSKNAKKYIDENPRIKAIDGGEFVDLLLQFYDKMDDEFKSKIKLEKIYLPVLDN